MQGSLAGDARDLLLAKRGLYHEAKALSQTQRKKLPSMDWQSTGPFESILPTQTGGGKRPFASQASCCQAEPKIIGPMGERNSPGKVENQTGDLPHAGRLVCLTSINKGQLVPSGSIHFLCSANVPVLQYTHAHTQPRVASIPT